VHDVGRGDDGHVVDRDARLLGVDAPAERRDFVVDLNAPRRDQRFARSA
jgi:hypothetical protein